MKRIIGVDNEVILSILTNELDILSIEYSVEKMDSVIYPTEISSGDKYAYIVSDEDNELSIKEIYYNIVENTKKETQKKVNTEVNPVLINLMKIMGGVLIVFIIVSQQITIHKLYSAMNIENEKFVYEWSKDLLELKTYTQNKKRLIGKSIDNDRNHIFELIESYHPNNVTVISEDKNQNYYYEKQEMIKDGLTKVIFTSSNDDGIYDKYIYMNEGKTIRTLLHDINSNEISIK